MSREGKSEEGDGKRGQRKDGGGGGMRALWKEMEQNTRIKATTNRSRSHPVIIGSEHVIWSTQSSSSFESTYSSNSSVASFAENDVSMEGKAQRPRRVTNAQPAPGASASSSSCPADVPIDSFQGPGASASSSSGPVGESPGRAYSVPPGFMSRPGLLETPDTSYMSRPGLLESLEAPEEIRAEPASSASSRQTASIPTSQAHVGEDMPPILEGDMHSLAAPLAWEEADPAAAVAARPAVRKAKARPRPPKPKREQGKILAEYYFKAQLHSEEQRELAEQHFLHTTRDDPQLYDYAHQVLRSLNAEARDRESIGEDPALTTVHR